MLFLAKKCLTCAEDLNFLPEMILAQVLHCEGTWQLYSIIYTVKRIT